MSQFFQIYETFGNFAYNIESLKKTENVQHGAQIVCMFLLTLSIIHLPELNVVEAVFHPMQSAQVGLLFRKVTEQIGREGLDIPFECEKYLETCEK